MTKIDAKSLERAFMPPGTPMLSEVMEKVTAHPDLSPTRRRDILSGLRRVAKALGRTPEDIPAHAAWLQKRIEKVAPAAIGLSPKSWQNSVSDARAGLVLCGAVEARKISRVDDLSAEWRRLWETVLASKDPSLMPLSRFVYFLNRFGVGPDDVSDEHAEAFKQALMVNEIGKAPDVPYRAAVNMWNLAVKRIPEWPRQTFALPSRSKTIKFDLAIFPKSFQGDLERYIGTLERPDLLDPLALTAPLRPETVRIYRASLVRFASVLVRAGVPSGSIKKLADLVTVKHAELGLRWLLAEKDGGKTRGISEMAGLLRNVAKRYVRVKAADQTLLDKLDARLAIKPQKGMTAKNRDRLRPLEDRETMRKLLLLPEQLFERSKSDGNLYRAALLREDALALAIFLNCPIRRKNMGQIHLEENLHRQGDGRVFLIFEADEVKNRNPIEFELPKVVVSMIDRHLATRTPQLCPPGTPWLFPRRDGGAPLHLDHFGARLKQRVLKELGLKVNVHLFRHIAAMNWLKARPGQYEALRRLLGHKERSQTINAYAGFEAGTATRLFGEVLEGVKR